MHEYNSQHDEYDALYNVVIEPFLIPNNFNTKILNQLIFTVHSQL